MTKRKNVFLMTDLGLKGLRDELLCHFLFTGQQYFGIQKTRQ